MVAGFVEVIEREKALVVMAGFEPQVRIDSA
jgi:hypothetical protein